MNKGRALLGLFFVCFWLLVLVRPAQADGIDQYTKLMLHFNGPNLSNTFTDSEETPKTITPNGNARISSDYSEFGGASLYLYGGDLPVPPSTDWNFSGDFTIDFWWNGSNSYNSNNPNPIVSVGDTSGYVPPYSSLYITELNGLVSVSMSSDGSDYDIANQVSMGTASSTGFDHYALVRGGNTYYTFQNGVLTNSFVNLLSPYYSASTGLYIGGYWDGANWTGNGTGYLDELRISNGIARWVSNFTPPDSQYTEGATPPVAGFWASPTSGPAMLPVQFMDTSTGSVSSWSWDFGDGSNSTAQYPCHIYQAQGTYAVSLTASGPGGSNTYTRANYTSVSPVAPGGIDQYTKLMLHFNGPNGSTTFTDSELTPKTITPNYNPQISSDYSEFGGASLYLNSGFLSVPPSTDWNFSGDFTIDFWWDHTGAGPIVSIGDTSGSTSLCITDFNGAVSVYMSSDGWSNDIANQVSMGTASGTGFDHYALVRAGNTYYTFQNGILTSSFESNLSPNYSTSYSLYIGCVYEWTSMGVWDIWATGYMDELRISNGISRWVSNFTPPDSQYTKGATPPVAGFWASPTSGPALFPVQFMDTSTGSVSSWSWDFGDGNTSTAQYPCHIYQAQGTYTVSLTASGPGGSNTYKRANYISVSSVVPGGIDQYTKLMLHFDGSNGSNTFLDSEYTPKTVQGYGDAQISTDYSVFGGASLKLDGSNGSYISIPASPDWNFSGNFTIDFWWKDVGGSNSYPIISMGDTSGSYSLLITDTNGGIVLSLSSNGINWDISNYIQIGTSSGTGFDHFAIVRAGSTYYTFQNGVLTGSIGSQLSPFYSGSNSLNIGYWSGYGYAMGYLDEFRISNGIVRWASNFTPPSSPYANGSVPPTASFSASQTSGPAPLPVQFTDTSTGYITNWSWTFGDGGTSTSQNPSHTYTNPGIYTVTLTAGGPGGSSNPQTTSITVIPTITASAGVNGSISPSGAVTVIPGTNQTFSFTPAAGYQVSSITVDGSAVAAASSYTFTNVTSNHTISVSFGINNYTGPVVFQSAMTTPVSKNSSLAVTYGSTPASNHLLVIFVAYSAYDGLRTCTPPSEFTSLGRVAHKYEILETFYKMADGATATYTFTFIGSAEWNSIVAYDIDMQGETPYFSVFSTGKDSVNNITTPSLPASKSNLSLSGCTVDTHNTVSKVSNGWGVDQISSPTNHSCAGASGAFNAGTISNNFTWASSDSMATTLLLIQDSPFAEVYFGLQDEASGSTGSPVASWNQSEFTCPGSGTQQIEDLSLYCAGNQSSQGGKLRLGIYDNNGNLVCQGIGYIAPVWNGGILEWQGYFGPSSITPNPATLTGGNSYTLVYTVGGVSGNWLNLGSPPNPPASTYYVGTDFTAGLPSMLPGSATSSTGGGQAIRCGIYPSGSSCPEANFSASPTNGSVPLAVSFTDQSTGNGNSWSWSFGDGGSSTSQSPAHTYSSPGSYTVTLTVSNSFGSSSYQTTITVNPPAPVANFIASPTSGVAPLAVSFTDSSTGGITSSTWNFGDGTQTISGTKSPTHQFAYPGIYNVALTVVGPGGTNTATQAVTVTLDNPQNVSVTPQPGWAALTWSPVAMPQFLDHYAVYMVEGSNFTSVSGMSPVKTCTTTGANVTGLQTGHTYYFAVTAVTAFGGQKSNVGTVYANIVVNQTGPTITNVQMNGSPLVSGATVTQSPAFTLTATDPAGMARVEFAFDGQLYSTDSNGSSQYSCLWNITSVVGGNHSLAITAYDSLGNKTTVSYTLAVEQSPPPAPVIKQPASGAYVSTPSITVQGSAQCNSQVMLYNNGSQAGSWTAVDSSCNFSLPLTLTQGTNKIQATAQNLKGAGPLCSPVAVTLDTIKPQAPANLSATSQPGGAIALSWRSTGTNIQGFNVYRASAPFSTTAGASRLNSSPIPATSYTDLPSTDGTYYYAVSAVDLANNESGLSANASAVSDRIPPVATSIVYIPQGQYDPVSGRTAPGVVNVKLFVSKPLSSIPFLSITPQYGVPISITLTQVSNLEYDGLFVITNTTPSGTAYAVFSARDLVGNRGTEIDAGGTILIDTTGPAINQLTIVPNQPIKNSSSSPVTIQVTFGLNKAVAPASTPVLNYILSDPGRALTPVTPLSQISPLLGQVQTWQGSFTLPADDGLKDAETLTFSYSGTDNIGNVSTQILCNNLFQVYQGNLPPLAAPSGLTGKAMPAGQVQLNWLAVQGAAGYELYRQAPGASSLTPYQRLGAVLQYTDSTSVDGPYTYAIASINDANGQETLSGTSAPVTVTAISTPPPAPSGLILNLTGQGIQAQWNPVVDSNPVTYSLYRDNVTPILSLQGLTPVASGITVQAVDPNPSTSMHYYAVTAVDAAGNQSEPPLTAVFLDFKLVPVSNLSAALNQGSPPVVSWTYPQPSGYTFNVLAGSPQAGTVQLNCAPLTALSITDTGYTGGDRTYTVTAVDSDIVQSIGSTITLPALNAVIQNGSQLKRGIMNDLVYVVTSQSSARVDNISIGASVTGNTGINHQCHSEVFGIDPGQTMEVPVVVGGYTDLPDVAAVQTALNIAPSTGESVRISLQSSQVNVGNGMLLLGIVNQQFTRGGTGQVQFTLQNTGEEEIEIVTMSAGNQSSSDVSFSLLDKDGNVLSSQTYTQNLGEFIENLSGGNSVAVIEPGQTFTSNPVTMDVPISAPDQVTMQLRIANLYYHQGLPDAVSMNGISTRSQISLVDTTYYGQVLSVSPQSSSGNQNIVISGDAVARSTGQPLPNAPLNLVISVNSFRRTYPVYTDSNGLFSYTFTPGALESGTYQVWANNPAILDNSSQAQFTITRVTFSPTSMSLKMPQNYEQSFKIQVATGDGTTVHNLRPAYNQADQSGGTFPQGVHVSIGNTVVELDPDQAADLTFTVWGDSTAPQNSPLVFEVTSDEQGTGSWGLVHVNLNLSDAQPDLVAAPSYVETGTALGQIASEVVTLSNMGLADLNNVTLSLVTQDGSPLPGWALLNSSQTLGTLPVGASQDINLSFAPTASDTPGVYNLYLQVQSSNYATTNVPVYVSVTLSGIGSGLFKVTDIYTGTVNSSGNIIQGLAGASITIQNVNVPTVQQTRQTDQTGESLFSNMAAGQYQYNISAANHQPQTGLFWIKPGVTTGQDVALTYNLVTIQWSVQQTTIQDQYQIVLNATYLTNVPAPVLVAQPSSVAIPAGIQAGDVFNGQVTFTNYGLINAENLSFTLPADDQYFKYEMLATVPATLAADGQFTVAYRITCLQTPGSSGEGTGGSSGCSTYSNCGGLRYNYQCAYGTVFDGSGSFCVTGVFGTCTSSTDVSSSTSGLQWSYSTPNGPDDLGGQSFGPPTPSPTQIQGAVCRPKRQCDPGDQCCLEASRQKVHSNVDILSGQYMDDVADMTIKIPGGVYQVMRQYYDNVWHFSDTQWNLTFVYGINGSTAGSTTGANGAAPVAPTGISSIVRSGVTYQAADSLGTVFTNLNMTIFAQPGGYLWQDTAGNWKSYDLTGRALAYGNRNLTLGTYVYVSGTLTAINDNSGNQVVSFQHDANGNITSVVDGLGNKVQYSYTNNLLTQVIDLLGNSTTYTYDSGGRITQKQDPEGRITNITYNNFGYAYAATSSDGFSIQFTYSYDSGSQQYYSMAKFASGKIRETWFDQYYRRIRTDLNGRTIETITYNNNNKIFADENSNLTYQYYDEFLNLTKEVWPDGSFFTNQYDPTLNVVLQHVDERGIATAYQYDDKGNPTQKVEAVGTPSERTIQFTYDATGNMLSTSVLADAVTAGATTAMTYDAIGNNTSTTDPEGNVTSFTYNQIGQVLTKTDPRGNVWSYGYDALGRLTGRTDPLGNVTLGYYDKVGNIVKIADAEGNATTRVYDAENRVISSTDALGETTQYTYDTDGNLTQTVDPSLKAITNQYDLDGRLTKVIDGDGNQIGYQYNNGGGGSSSCSACTAAERRPAFDGHYSRAYETVRL